jgi:DNA mismatch repair protein MSH2
LTQARHAVLEEMRINEQEFVPNDASLIQGQSHLVSVTGANAGGKSVYLRTVALCVLMAQIGCFVPAATATLSVVDRILARIGAGDSTQRALSTFLVEMLEASSILKLATPHSLVLVDELGRGTSADDGLGLAMAIGEALARKACFTLYATHFFELNQLETSVPGVRTLHVRVHPTPNGLLMLYTVAPGPAQQSDGVHVARVAKLPASVIQEAELESQRGLQEQRQPAALLALLHQDVGSAAQIAALPAPELMRRLRNLKAHLRSSATTASPSHMEVD